MTKKILAKNNNVISAQELAKIYGKLDVVVHQGTTIIAPVIPFMAEIM